MSGPIRSCIGPAKANLARILNESQHHIDTRPNQDAPINEWTTWVQRLRNDLLRLQNIITRMDGYIQRWNDLIFRLPAEERPDENAEWDNASGGADGFLAKMEEGHEMIATLTSNIEIVQGAINLLSQQNAPPKNPYQNAQNPNPNAQNPVNQGHHQSLVRLPKNGATRIFWRNYTLAILLGQFSSRNT